MNNTPPPPPPSGYSVLSQSATVTTGNTPIIQISNIGGTISYMEVNNSIGSGIVLGVVGLIFQASSVQKLPSKVEVKYKAGTGVTTTRPDVYQIDPYQSKGTLDIDMSYDNVIIEGNTWLDVVVRANSTLQVQIYGNKQSFEDYLNGVEQLFETPILNPEIYYNPNVPIKINSSKYEIQLFGEDE